MGDSPSSPLRPLLTNQASAASKLWRGRELLSIVGELVGTTATAVITGEVQPLLLWPASIDTHSKFSDGIHQHLIAVPVGELLINPRQGEGGLRHSPHIIVSLATSLHAEVVGVQARKSGDVALIRSHCFRHSSPLCGFPFGQNVL